MAAKKYTLAVQVSPETTRLLVTAAASVVVIGLAQRTANAFGEDITPGTTAIGLADLMKGIVTPIRGGAPTSGTLTECQTTLPLTGNIINMVFLVQSQPRATATTASTHHPATAA